MSYSITEFEHLYTSHVSRCMRLAMSLLRDEEEARDVVQEVFIKLWESNMVLHTPEAFLLRAVRNAALDRIKAASIHERIRRGLPLEPSEPPDSQHEREQRREAVLQAVRTLLSAREQQVVDKVYEEGLSYKATAESLQVSVALVNKSLVNAMKILRTHFKQHKR